MMPHNTIFCTHNNFSWAIFMNLSVQNYTNTGGEDCGDRVNTGKILWVQILITVTTFTEAYLTQTGQMSCISYLKLTPGSLPFLL